MSCNLASEPKKSPRPDPVKRTGEMITALQNAGYGPAEIVDALLWEAGWMIECVAKGEAEHLRDEFCRIVSEFSDSCVGLIEQPRTPHRGQH